MSPAEEGAYLHLLCTAMSNGSLPHDDVFLANASRLGRDWLKSKDKIEKEFYKRKGRLFPRCRELQ
jgi:uncharacterized protein YdaU (DUF1376 family)